MMSAEYPKSKLRFSIISPQDENINVNLRSDNMVQMAAVDHGELQTGLFNSIDENIIYSSAESQEDIASNGEHIEMSKKEVNLVKRPRLSINQFPGPQERCPMYEDLYTHIDLPPVLAERYVADLFEKYTRALDKSFVSAPHTCANILPNSEETDPHVSNDNMESPNALTNVIIPNIELHPEEVSPSGTGTIGQISCCQLNSAYFIFGFIMAVFSITVLVILLRAVLQ